ELARYMQQSSVVVLPSRKESLGMVLVESLACGTPVVATRSGGPEDIVNEKVGVLVPPEDPEALADAIQRVLQRPEDFARADLTAYAFAKYSGTPMSKEYLELYQEALARHDRARSV